MAETEFAEEYGEEAAVDDPAEDDGQVADEPSLEEVLQTEVENLADEIAQAEEEGVDPVHLEALESGIEASAEALVSMREARVKLAEVRKDRGFKGPPGSSSAKAKGKPGILAKKAKFPCYDCNMPGHWAGDPECTRLGAGLGRPKAKAVPKQVRLAEAAGNEVSNAETVRDTEGHEALVVTASEVTLTCRALDGSPMLLERLNAGHLALKLIPDAWPVMAKESRWRRLGPDGVLEFPLHCRLWAAQLMRARRRGGAPAPLHDHNVTEASLQLGELAFAFHNVLCAAAQASMQPASCTSTAPTSPPSSRHGGQTFGRCASWARRFLQARGRRGRRAAGDHAVAAAGGAHGAPT